MLASWVAFCVQWLAMDVIALCSAAGSAGAEEDAEEPHAARLRAKAAASAAAVGFLMVV
jgi:hypothetical protein